MLSDSGCALKVVGLPGIWLKNRHLGQHLVPSLPVSCVSVLSARTHMHGRARPSPPTGAHMHTLLPIVLMASLSALHTGMSSRRKKSHPQSLSALSLGQAGGEGTLTESCFMPGPALGTDGFYFKLCGELSRCPESCQCSVAREGLNPHLTGSPSRAR